MACPPPPQRDKAGNRLFPFRLYHYYLPMSPIYFIVKPI
jgi:hypothetical protein